MDDSISRQAAIDEITEYGSGDSVYMSVGELKRRIEQLPSAQQTTCKYWDDESSFCALHRPSAQPETRCVAEVKIDGEELQECVDKAVRQIAENMPEQRWIPCSERLSDEEVLCCDTRGEMIIGYPYPDEESNTGFSAESNDVFMIDCAAWMPLPEPYKEDKE